MIKDKRNIDILFEERLKGFKEKPPTYSWDKLDKSLDGAKFKKSMIFLRWMAASILIILAFGSGYYYAVYNLNSSNIADKSNNSKLDQQNNKPTDQQLFDNSKSNIAETTILEKQQTKTEQFENATLPGLNDEFFASHDNSDIDKNQMYTSDKIIPIVIDQGKFMEIMTSMEKISFTNIPIDQQLILLLDYDNEVPAIETEMAIANPAPMSIYYYPEDYDLNTPKKELDAKWAVGAQFAPVVSYRDISINYENQQGNYINDNESQLNNSEDALHSYAGGIDVNYHVSKRWSIQSGLYFSRIGQVNNDALNFKQEDGQYQLFSINTSTGSVNIAFEKVPNDVRKVNPPKDTLESIDIGNVKIIQNFDLFEIPVMIKYNVLNKRFGINLSGGLSPAYLVSNNTYLEVENTKHDIGSSDNLNPMIFNTTFALGLNYGITKKLTINFEPTFKYSLSPINSNSEFYYHPYSFSWYTGIRYSF